MLNHSQKQMKQWAVNTIVSPLFFVALNLAVLFVLGYSFLSPVYSVLTSLARSEQVSEATAFYQDQDFLDLAVIDNEDVASPYVGTHYGRIQIDAVNLDVKLYWGDTDAILNKGAGQYIGSSMPGYQKPLLIGGHNLTYFKPLKDVEIDDEIVITTHYAKYVYKVIKLDVVDYRDMEAFDLGVMDEVLMLYTCHPFEILWSRKTDRFVVYGERVEGPDVK